MTLQPGESTSPIDLQHLFPEFVPRLLQWYREAARPLPWRILWQTHKNPYHVWISEIMLQQTVIKAVIPAYHRFLQQFPDVPTLAAASTEEVKLASRGLGYYRRFGLLHRAAQDLAQRSQNKDTIAWPRTFAEWRSLPGIGDYTAAAIGSIAFHIPKAVVDGNVERLYCRLFDLRQPPNTPALKKIFQQAGDRVIPRQHPGDFNQALMEMGQTVCTKTSPNCSMCPFQSACLAHKHQSQHLAPATKAKIPHQDLFLTMEIPVANQRFGLIYRDVNWRFLKDSWGFPYTIHDKPKGKSSRTHFKHMITHHKIHVQVQKSAPRPGMEYRWLTAEELLPQLVGALDHKAFKALSSRY